MQDSKWGFIEILHWGLTLQEIKLMQKVQNKEVKKISIISNESHIC